MCYNNENTSPLTRNLDILQTLPAVPNQILEWVAQGVPIPFKDTTMCPKFVTANDRMSAQETAFASQEIKDLLDSGVIELCSQTPHCISGLKVVPKSGSGKFRLIADLRQLNESRAAPKFQYEDIKCYVTDKIW